METMSSILVRWGVAAPWALYRVTYFPGRVEYESGGSDGYVGDIYLPTPYAASDFIFVDGWFAP